MVINAIFNELQQFSYKTPEEFEKYIDSQIIPNKSTRTEIEKLFGP